MGKIYQQRTLAACYAVTIFVSAFLVFQVQPIISKTILPWFGGSPAVWTTCMLFFQLLLFAGYAYAHLISMRLSPRWQAALHLGLLTGALLLLPIMPKETWKPASDGNPTWQIMLLLSVHVGLPYFLLASTGPLLQAWFSRSFAGRSPYRLYALSNVGSLLALVSYPFLIEPAMTVSWQATAWSLGFCLFSLLGGLIALSSRRMETQDELLPQSSPQCPANAPSAPVSSRLTQASWVLLPTLASVMLLATTNHVCQDVAVVPFLWVAPLSLYLLSFIICFDNPAWYVPRYFVLLTLGANLAIAFEESHPGTIGLVGQIALYFAALFGICMICHGELVRRKPPVRELTKFYLMSSAGGALGGIIVTLICPMVFSSFVEMPIGMGISMLVAVWVYIRNRPPAPAGESLSPKWKGLKTSLQLAILFGLLIAIGRQINQASADSIAASRNFYGRLQVLAHKSDNLEEEGRSLVHGRIVHGYQFSDPARRRTPTLYYAADTGIGLVMRRFRPERPRRVGLIGLGAGTLAAYGRQGDTYRFYEINPDVIDTAQRYFSFLSDCPAKIEIVLGDARLSLQRESPQAYDILVVDAFSGDAIPTHLLTREVMPIYKKHLQPEGVLAFHISNRHLDLTPVVARLAEYAGLRWELVRIRESPSASDWILLTNNEQFWNDEEVHNAIAKDHGRYTPVPLWTDEYSNLFQLLK